MKLTFTDQTYGTGYFLREQNDKSQADDQCRRVIVLDTSAFVAGFDPFSLGVEQVTVPKVEEEIRRNSMVKMRLEMAIESGKLKVKAPTQEFS